MLVYTAICVKYLVVFALMFSRLIHEERNAVVGFWLFFLFITFSFTWFVHQNASWVFVLPLIRQLKSLSAVKS